MKKIEKIKEFGGWLERYEHPSEACQCNMRFSIYLPPQVKNTAVPLVYWLSGLTCTDENMRTKAGAQRYAAELGLALVMPDTSPRGVEVADAARYDLGQGASFYVDATQAPWNQNYHMYRYVTEELPTLVESQFPVKTGVRAISGHSMGGHGALICALKNPEKYRSVSAFAPICHPSVIPWGKECFSAYLGEDSANWANYDATELIKKGAKFPPVLIDQGTEDEFLPTDLCPEALEKAAPGLKIRRQAEYDHSYHFVATFIGEHLAFHHRHLNA